MPLLETRGAASVQGFGSLAASARNYIEDVFSTYLYTGNGSTQTITNGIDLAGKGGLVWIKNRSSTVPWGHALIDTARGNFYLQSQLTDAQIAQSQVTLGSTGFSINGAGTRWNNSGDTYVSWTFRKQPKFFDVVTYTGDGVAGRAISHSLGSAPGCIIVKQTSGSGSNWFVYHRSNGNNGVIYLNQTAAFAGPATFWNQQDPTASVFYVGGGSTNVSSESFVAYLFAHDAGGFGASGSDNVISCGSFTTDGSGNATVTLGYEPQWLLQKSASGTVSVGNWFIPDNMRGMPVGAGSQLLRPNLADAESNSSPASTSPSATGFSVSSFQATTTYIYIAIRRGPMKTPTTGTSVYTPIARTGTNAAGSITTVGFPPDLSVSSDRTATGRNPSWTDRLRGATQTLYSSATNGETVSTSTEDLTSFARMNGVDVGTWNKSVINAPSDIANWFFRRAPGFFDVVCYTGTASVQNVAHNLGVVPEFIIVKKRNVAANWPTYHSALGNTKSVYLDVTNTPFTNSLFWNNTSPTASVFTVGLSANTGDTGTYVAYLFATCSGVSKVGSYTGTGNTLQIDCGFTGGARFVLIRRTDNTGDWYVWDSARGIVAGSDPYLTLNTTAAEVTTTDWVDTYSAGFELSNAGGNNVNINGATYIFLSVA